MNEKEFPAKAQSPKARPEETPKAANSFMPHPWVRKTPLRFFAPLRLWANKLLTRVKPVRVAILLAAFALALWTDTLSNESHSRSTSENALHSSISRPPEILPGGAFVEPSSA